MSPPRPRTPAYWFGGQAPPLPARALAVAYGGAIGLRRWLYARRLLRQVRVAAPVVVVGNLIAGGSGKTPLVLALVERLRAAGWNPGVASRGYGRQQPGTPRWVDRDTDPALGGDEPVLIARNGGVRVRADGDRAAAARALVAAGCDVVVCDDGLQHYRLARDVEIEVIDGRRRYGNGQLLPAGPLREPATRGDRCDFRVVNSGSARGAADADAAGFGEWPMRLLADHVLPLHGVRPRPLAAFAGKRVHAVAGIGDPERFFTMLRGLDIAVIPHAFPDHHRYVADDLQFGNDLPVLMTDKDAIKVVAPASGIARNDRWFTVPVRAELPEAFWIALLDRIARAGARGGVAATALS